MALRRRGSRLIHVDDVTYRWVISPDSGYMHLVVEAEGGRGQRLVVQMPYLDVYASETGPATRQQTVVSPGVVRRCILRAISAGWDTNASAVPFTMGAAMEDLQIPDDTR